MIKCVTCGETYPEASYCTYEGVTYCGACAPLPAIYRYKIRTSGATIYAGMCAVVNPATEQSYLPVLVAFNSGHEEGGRLRIVRPRAGELVGRVEMVYNNDQLPPERFDLSGSSVRSTIDLHTGEAGQLYHDLHIRGLVTMHVNVAGYSRCTYCGDYTRTEYLEATDRGAMICHTCRGNYHWCEQCGTLTTSWTSVRTPEGSGQHLCAHCMDSGLYIRCDGCGVWHSPKLMDSCGDYLVCPRCADTVAPCDCCGERTPGELLTSTQSGDLICENCLDSRYWQCEACNEWIDNAERATLCEGDYICDACAEGASACDRCGEIYYDHNMYPRRGQVLCRDCHDAAREDGLTWHRTEPGPCDFRRMPGEERETAFAGTELEMDGGDDPDGLADALRRALGDFIDCKTDGSLTSDGLEVATMPATLAWHRSNDWRQEVHDAAVRYGYRSHDAGNCGLHVHLSRECLGDSQDAQDIAIAKLIIVSCRFYDSHLLPFARRRPDQASEWCARNPDIPITAGDTDDEALRKYRDTYPGGRYRAINTCNDCTVEFRIFRGSLVPDTILASIELCYAIRDYVISHTVCECARCDWQELIDADKYPTLAAYDKTRRNRYNPDLIRSV